MKKELKNLMIIAMEARNYAYCPYSYYSVGAALLCADGRIVTGSNIENASYGVSNCAERTAFFKAVSEDEREFEAIAIVGALENTEPTEYAYPCGICRQVMSEFCHDDFKVIVARSIDDYKIYTLGELLPASFGGDSIK